MSKIRIGIDIGEDGGYAIFVDGNLSKYGLIPSTETELDMKALSVEIFSHIHDDLDIKDVSNIHAVIEDLHSIYGTSAASNFTFGLNNGLIISMLQCYQIPYTKVQAKKWQKEMFEGIRPVEVVAKQKKVKGVPAEPKKDKNGNIKYKIDTKATALVAAKRLFPNKTFLPTERSKVPHNGIVDAVLIAAYCNRHF